MAQYIGKDKERYDQGNKFLSLNTYLQNYQDKAPITFNPSRSNTGIMSQYPYPYPIIPQDDGGDGGGPPGPRGPGYGYTSLYDPVTQNKEFQDDIGVGTITKEEEEFAKAQELRQGLITIGKAAFFGPRNYTLGKGIGEGIGFGINKVKDFFGNDGGSDEININKDGIFTKESIDQSFAGEEGPTGGQTASSGTVDTGNFEQDGTGRQGYRDGGYSSEDNEEQQAQDQASFDAGNRTDDYTDMYSGDGGNPPPFYSTNEPTNTPNLDFSLVKDVNPAFSYANNVGRFGGMLDTTKTIEEEEPVGTVGYFSPSNNFGIGFDTDLGMVGKANLGNLNIGYTGQGGVNASYMDDFAGGAGRFGVNYGKDGLNLGLRFEKNFNNGGIVGLYR